MKEYGTINDKIYFAAAPIDEIGDRLAGKVSDYYQYLTSSALVDLWRRSSSCLWLSPGHRQH